VKPWILIHGWKAGPEKWKEWTTEDEGFLELEKDHIPYATVDLRPDADPNTRARRLAQEIDMIRIEKNWRDVKVNLVAHSQGGLDARAYLRGLGDKAKDQVYSLTMIATPNHGTVLAYIAGVRYLTPRWVERFNRATPKAEGVAYYTLAGSKVGPLSWLLWGEDDGIVPVSSVHLDDAIALGCSPDTATCPYEHNELVERREVYDAVKSQTDPDFPEEPNSPAFVAIKDGDILAGQPVSRTIVVDGLKEVAFVVASSAPLDFSLQSPQGERITVQTQDARVSYYAGEGLGLVAQSYVVRQPASGTWMAQVSGDIEGQHFTLLASAENTFALDGSTDEYFNRVGEKVKLRAALDTDASITDMRADITDPNGSRITVVLYDDGLHEDDLPGDGVYGNVFFPSCDGDYMLVFSAKGVVGGREFSRADLESIVVEAPTVVEQ
jgi:hypothetical protein